MYRVTTNIGEVKNYLSTASAVAFDFETSPDEPYRDDNKAALDANKASIVGVSYSVGEGSAIYVPIAHRIGDNADESEVMAFLAEFAANKNIVKIAHHLAFEAMFLYKHGIVLQQPCHDTFSSAQMSLKSNTTFRKMADGGLKTLTREVLDVDLPTFSEVTSGRFFDELDPSDAETIRYACADADFTLRLYHVFNEWFFRWMPKHRYIVEELESPTAVFTGLMKLNGILVDTERMNACGAECEERLVKLREDIAFITGDVNIGANASTSIFKQFLYKDLGLPVLKTTAKYQEAADDEALIMLAEWCEENRPDIVALLKLVQEYRRQGKIKSTYIDGYAKYTNTATGRIHADLLPLATETGRFVAKNPNLQNMPRTGADDIGVRNFIIAPEGKVLLSLDFSQIELRVGAFYCKDERMLETYRTGGDIHDQTATVIYGEGKHDSEQRTIAKNVNFGTFYGLFPRGLQRTLKFKAGISKSLADCERIIANIKAGYPKLTSWQETTKAAAKRNRYTETHLGRRRYLPDINSTDWSKRSFAERCALNSPIQGTAADILKLALGRIIAGLPERPWLRPLLQIHDELVFEVPENMITEAVTFIKQCMEQQPFEDFDVPIIAEAAVGKRFGEMRELEV